MLSFKSFAKLQENINETVDMSVYTYKHKDNSGHSAERLKHYHEDHTFTHQTKIDTGEKLVHQNHTSEENAHNHLIGKGFHQVGVKHFDFTTESIASQVGHDANSPFKTRYNPTHGQYELVNTNSDRVLSLHSTEKRAKEEADKNNQAHTTESVAVNDNVPGGIKVIKPVNDNYKRAPNEKPIGKDFKNQAAMTPHQFKQHLDSKNNIKEDLVNEIAPPGFEGTVKAMQKHKDITNPWALAWWQKKQGYKSHKED